MKFPFLFLLAACLLPVSTIASADDAENWSAHAQATYIR